MNPWTTRIGGTFFMESGYPISRFYNNGNYGDYGNGSILKDTIGSYARTMTWWEAQSLGSTSDTGSKRKNFGPLPSSKNITNNRTGDFAFISFDNRWIINQRQNPIRITVGGRYQF